ncbi:MAG TPA: hypothetical protein VFH48_24180 [Chloroflexota bacterium]|nr:hypothetical protein [Chloroflexota bacterium]
MSGQGLTPAVRRADWIRAPRRLATAAVESTARTVLHRTQAASNWARTAAASSIRHLSGRLDGVERDVDDPGDDQHQHVQRQAGQDPPQRRP